MKRTNPDSDAFGFIESDANYLDAIPDQYLDKIGHDEHASTALAYNTFDDVEVRKRDR